MTYKEKMDKRVEKAKTRNRKKNFKDILSAIKRYADIGYTDYDFYIYDSEKCNYEYAIEKLKKLGFKVVFNNNHRLYIYWGDNVNEK